MKSALCTALPKRSLWLGPLLGLWLALPSAHAADLRKPCDQLKSEIEAKLTQGGVKGFTLVIVAKDDPAPGKAVGTCGGGTKKILYTKN